jgi:hypothetical protein
VTQELDGLSNGGNMKRTKSCKGRRVGKQQEEQESFNLDEEMIRRLYIGSDSGSS